ncbi:MAG: DUF4357 domain-containing protein [Bacteroidaceae bacterium]|nr:DUF4357 domain-containing protein [Bacteroidaceae bacterium]
MTKEEIQNINDEYEKLVPPTKRESIFKESEDYESLRQYIICQPSIVYQKDKLPFSEVKVTSYVEYKKQDVIEKERPNWHIFFLRQSKKGQPDYCDAAGYFIRKTKEFVLLPFSHIITIPLGVVPSGYSRKGELDGINLYIKSSITFRSPEEAASYVLGQSAGMGEWIDSRGKGLLVYYKELAEPKPQPNLSLFDVGKDGQEQMAQTLAQPYGKHIVFIRENGLCDASGYHDPVTGHFYILKNSKISLHVAAEFAETPVGKARERLISSNCKEVDGYFVVQKDSKCRNATAAASYTLGKAVTYVEWESADGKALKDFYPDRFYRKKTSLSESFSKNTASTITVQSATIEDVSEQIFFIKKTKVPGRECDAKGRYDKVTRNFVILAGSTWSFEVTKSYQYTASELVRRGEIKKSCKKTSNEIKQFRDVICDSPSQAASFVLGRVANGWEEWLNKDGHTLKSIYMNVKD